MTFEEATKYFSKYDDAELFALLGKLGIMCDTMKAGPLSNGRRTMLLLQLEMLRRNNIKKMRTKIEVVEETALATTEE